MWTLMLLILCTISLLGSVLLNIKQYREKKELANKKNIYKGKLKQAKDDLRYCQARLSNQTAMEVSKELKDTPNLDVTEGINNVFLDEREYVRPSGLTTEWKNVNDDKQALKKSSDIFFQRPIGDGYFQMNDASNEHKARFVYRVELNDDRTVGVLHLEPTHPSDLELLRNFPETILESACKYENSFSNNFQTVVQVAPGAVVSNGDNLHITEKVKIQFI